MALWMAVALFAEPVEAPYEVILYVALRMLGNLTGAGVVQYCASACCKAARTKVEASIIGMVFMILCLMIFWEQLENLTGGRDSQRPLL